MDKILLIKVAIVIFGLLLVGVGLTIYEFREHIMAKLRKRVGKLDK